MYSGNMILCRLANCDAIVSLLCMATKYHIEPHDVVRFSVARIKDSFWFYFSDLVYFVLSVFLYCVLCHVFYCSCCIHAY